jgi:hypothetical protein
VKKMKKQPTFLLHYRVVSKDFPTVQCVTDELEHCLTEWKKAKMEAQREGTITDVYVEVWKAHEYKGKHVWIDESDGYMYETLANYL